MIYPTITLMSGAKLKILGVDAGKAPAFARRFDNPESAEDAVKVVDECIDRAVPLWVKGTSHGPEVEPWWSTVRPHAVASVNCDPFD